MAQVAEHATAFGSGGRRGFAAAVAGEEAALWDGLFAEGDGGEGGARGGGLGRHLELSGEWGMGFVKRHCCIGSCCSVGVTAFRARNGCK